FCGSDWDGLRGPGDSVSGNLRKLTLNLLKRPKCIMDSYSYLRKASQFVLLAPAGVIRFGDGFGTVIADSLPDRAHCLCRACGRHDPGPGRPAPSCAARRP